MSIVPEISGKVTVSVPVEQAFRVFTSSFGSWWPREYHYGQAEMAEAILESGEGGRWFERGTDGTERDWGRVLVWEPPQRLVVTWQTNGQIEVRFTADGPGQTVVELEHRHLDRLVGGDAIRGMIVSGGGWNAILELFAKAAQ